MSRKYSEQQIEEGLVAAATFGLRPAGRELGIPEATIRNWIAAQPDRYAEIRAQEAPKWRARAAARMEDVVDDLSETEGELSKRLRREVENLEPRDVAPALQKTSLAKAINADKANVLRGQPTEIVKHVQADHLIRKLEAAGVLAVEDVVDATVVESAELSAGDAA